MKKPRISTLKKKLWKSVSAFIRRRDKGVCQSCGKTGLSGSNYHAGHLIPKSICGKALEFSELNLYGQCFACNIWASGNSAILAENISKKLGYNITEHLNKIRLKHKGEQWSVEELQVLIKKYEI